LSDQGLDLQGQAGGYCYVRVELCSNHYGDTETGTFSITAHDENTFPWLTLGQTLSNQELELIFSWLISHMINSASF